jgi:hypothetical protein
MTTKEYETKYFFCVKELKWLCQEINDRVLDVYYTYNADSHEEYVSIIFKNGHKKRICVTADSLKAIAQDVIKEI